jgi:hypothetical protein
MMSNAQTTKWILAGTIACAVLTMGPPAVAVPVQGNNQNAPAQRRPPRPKPAAKAPIVTSALLGAVLSGVVIFAGLMPVKRGHQD